MTGAVVEVATFWVAGIPQPQGSKTAFVVKGRAVIVDKNPALLKPWRAAIAKAARDAFVSESVPIEGPVVVHAEFRFVRPKSVKREFPSVRPDVDKLARALLDGITDAGNVWGDDSQVVTLRGQKVYADEAGAWVRIGVMKGAGA